MQAYEWAIISGLFTILATVAGFLGSKVIKHGEQIAALQANHDAMDQRFDRQDRLLEDMNRKLDDMRGILTSPYRHN